jgi:hypothetical protein
MSARIHSRFWRAAFLAGAVLAVTAVSAAPVGAAPRNAKGDNPWVVLTGSVDVAPGEQTDTVVIFDGPATVDGRVEGAVVAFNGDVLVTGTVTEDVLVFNGRATISGTAHVGGDVRSSSRPVVAVGATVDGSVVRQNFAGWFRSAARLVWFAWWVALSVSSLVLGLMVLLLAPRPFRVTVDVARERPATALGWGIAVAVGLPVASVLAILTLLGTPLGFFGLLALAVLGALGYTVAGVFLGRLVVREPANVLLAFLAGWAALRAVDLIPVLGGLVGFAASALGIGALAVAAWPRVAERGTGAVVAPAPSGPEVSGAPPQLAT